MFPRVTKTATVRSVEDDPYLPVFVGGPSSERDGRVQLEDGTLAYDLDGGLYLFAVAMDAGDNVVRRFAASQRGIGGITAATGPGGSGLAGERGQLHCIGVEQIGWLDAR